MDLSNITSMYSDVYANATNASADKLKSQISSSDYSSATDDELMDVCKQFESYFLEQVFKEMQNTIITSDDSDSSTSQLVDYYKDQMIQTLASESTEQNSLGLAQILYEQMRRNLGLDDSQLTSAAEDSTAADDVATVATEA
jgi:flagellar protein FlgJ